MLRYGHRFIGLVFVLVAQPLLSAEHDRVIMGPLLHYQDIQDPAKAEWGVSVLYLIDMKGHQPPVLSYVDKQKINFVFGKKISEKFGQSFVKYDLRLKRRKSTNLVSYNIPGQRRQYAFAVPQKGRPPRMFYHSCNGYQNKKDRERVNGIAPMWTEINRLHEQEKFHLQLGGGDQIYADGFDGSNITANEPVHNHTYGLLALATVQEWLKSKNRDSADLSESLQAEVDRFYFDQYIRHFNEAQFRDAMAEIPGLFQMDDHDYFDGFGSRNDSIQNSPVFRGIGKIARWYGFLIQHHLAPDEQPIDKNRTPRAHNFLHEFNELAILGLDTRSERNSRTVVSRQTWEDVFARIKQLSPAIRHLVVMLSVPVVYPSGHRAEKLVTRINDSSIGHKVLQCTSSLDEFKLPGIADDCSDGWGGAHAQERLFMIENFFSLANEKKISVTILSGDVHLAGAGKIYQKKNGKKNDMVIWQLISSPIGNVPVEIYLARTISVAGRLTQDLGHDFFMKLIKLDKLQEHGTAHRLIAHRNFITIKLQSNLDLDVEWHAEPKKIPKPFKHYFFSIPALSITH